MKYVRWIKPDQAIQQLSETLEAGSHTQEKIMATRDRYQRLFDAVSDSVFVFHKGELLMMNSEARTITDRTGTGQQAFQRNVYEQGLKTLHGLSQHFVFKTHDGEEMIFMVQTCTTLQLEAGECVLITLVDVTTTARLSEQVETMTWKERKRISRDLHDGLSQLLSSLALQTKALTLKHRQSDQAEPLKSIAARAARSMDLGTEIYRKLDQI